MPVPDPQRASRRIASEVATVVRLPSQVLNAQVTRRHPVSVVHFVTRRCNARCSFCFVDFSGPVTSDGELTADEIDRLTHTLGPRLENVNLTGGEPFLRKDLDRIVASYYRNAGVRSVYITSNGSQPARTEALARSVGAEFPDRKLIVSLSVDAFAEDHDRIRRVKGLFAKVLQTYAALREVGHDHPGVMVNLAITVSHENHDIVADLYESLVEDHGIRSITAVIVRDEGVYQTPRDHKEAILDAYRGLTASIGRDLRTGRLEGYDPSSLQGRLMNGKNAILWDVVADTYLEPRFVSTCHAGTLFGVIDHHGDVFPCEVLDRPIGNVRDHGLDFSAVWASDAAKATASWIKDSECHCSYECAWAFNILGNARYQPRLLAAALRR